MFSLFQIGASVKHEQYVARKYPHRIYPGREHHPGNLAIPCCFGHHVKVADWLGRDHQKAGQTRLTAHTFDMAQDIPSKGKSQIFLFVRKLYALIVNNDYTIIIYTSQNVAPLL